MYDSELFLEAKNLFRNHPAFLQLFSGLPSGTELRVLLDNRIPCTLKFSDRDLVLLGEDTSRADIELTLFSESIRRLRNAEPDSLLDLLGELGALSVREQAKIKMKSQAKDLYTKGYLHSIKGMGPELKKDLSSLAFQLVGKLSQATSTIKNLLKK